MNADGGDIGVPGIVCTVLSHFGLCDQGIEAAWDSESPVGTASYNGRAVMVKAKPKNSVEASD